MYEFHGWVNIVEDSSDESESSVLEARQEGLIAALEHRLQALRNSPVFVHIARALNGQAHLLISGVRNHRDERVLDLFRWIAEHQPSSYGLLHVRDDEDRTGADNAFVVHAVRRGELASAVEPSLSPCVPVIERPWQSAGSRGSERDDSRDE